MCSQPRLLCLAMTPLSPTPDWAVSRFEIVAKFDDPEVLQAALELLVVLTGLNDKDRHLPDHVAIRDDATRAAIDFGYRRTPICANHCEEDLGIAV